MHMEHVGFIGWIHALACTAALLLGGYNILAVKGTPLHRAAGRYYVLSMLIANTLALAIFHFDIAMKQPPQAGPDIFGIFHWMAVWALGFTLFGWLAGRNQRYALAAYAHPVMMILGYYLLLGGLVNELFARLDILRPLATHLVNGQRQFGSAAVGLSQFAVMVVTLLLVLTALFQVWRYRRKLVKHA